MRKRTQDPKFYIQFSITQRCACEKCVVCNLHKDKTYDSRVHSRRHRSFLQEQRSKSQKSPITKFFCRGMHTPFLINLTSLKKKSYTLIVSARNYNTYCFMLLQLLVASKRGVLGHYDKKASANCADGNEQQKRILLDGCSQNSHCGSLPKNKEAKPGKNVNAILLHLKKRSSFFYRTWDGRDL